MEASSRYEKKRFHCLQSRRNKHRVFGKELLKKKSLRKRTGRSSRLGPPSIFFIIRSPNFRISKTIREDARSKPQNFHQDQDRTAAAENSAHPLLFCLLPLQTTSVPSAAPSDSVAPRNCPWLPSRGAGAGNGNGTMFAAGG